MLGLYCVRLVEIGIVFMLEDSREISFEIETWFSEMITIQRGYNLIKKFPPTNDFLERQCYQCRGRVFGYI